jgi:hypothetical protein
VREELVREGVRANLLAPSETAIVDAAAARGVEAADAVAVRRFIDTYEAPPRRTSAVVRSAAAYLLASEVIKACPTPRRRSDLSPGGLDRALHCCD